MFDVEVMNKLPFRIAIISIKQTKIKIRLIVK